MESAEVGTALIDPVVQRKFYNYVIIEQRPCSLLSWTNFTVATQLKNHYTIRSIMNLAMCWSDL